MHLLISSFAFLAVGLPAALVAQGSQTISLAEARKLIQDGNIEWSKDGVAIDKSAFERMLAPWSSIFKARGVPSKLAWAGIFLD